MTLHDLSAGAWTFGHAPPQPLDFAGDDRAAVAEWLPASVPGDVRADLLAAGHIPDPYIGDQLAASRWADRCDWWYRCRLHAPLDPDQRTFVTFAGVDYHSAVYAGAACLGRHTGMFSPHTYELTPHLRQSPELELAVRIWGSASLPRLRRTPAQRLVGRLARALGASQEPYPDRFATLKMPMSYGWDFAPPLLTMGIWDDVTLKLSGPAAILDLWPNAEWPAGDFAVPATLSVALAVEIDSVESVDALLDVRLEEPAESQTFPTTETQRPQSSQTITSEAPLRLCGVFPLALRAGRRVYTFHISIDQPRLWFPWDRGEPCLYLLRAGLHRAGDGAPLDDAATSFGLRHIRRRPTDGAPADAAPWAFEINGQREYIRGLNWVPADAMPGRLRPADYEQLVGMARAAGANLLRVWGGGLREKRAFYAACDRAGMLVWQEFPFACAFLGRLPRDPAYLAQVRGEADAIVRRLRNHPSLVLWCGGNEISPRRNRPVIDVLAEAVAQGDGSRPFQPASPYGGDAHNWDIWHGQAPARNYRRDRSLFTSELGLQAAPDLASLQRFLPPADLWPAGAGWASHGAQLDKLRIYAASYLRDNIVDNVADNIVDNVVDCTVGHACSVTPPRLESFVAATQRAQARALQIAVEHFRRRKGPCGGLALWQFNEPWPAISWSLVDYFRRPKLAGQLLARWYAPLLVSLDYPLRRYAAGDVLRGALWVVNDGLEEWPGCVVRLLQGERVLWSGPADVGHDESRRIAGVALPIADPALALVAELWQGERRLAVNDYDLTYWERRRGMTPRDWLSRRVADWLLR